MSGQQGKYLITGAAGYVGGSLCRKFLAERCKISVIVRDKERFRDSVKENVHGTEWENITIYEADITDTDRINNINDDFDYIIHCAAVTRSSSMVSKPVEVADGIVLGTRNILELAKRCGVRSMVYISSMEVYGKVKYDGVTVTEDMSGEVDILNARSCYPMGKRMAEQYCYGYFSEYGVPVKIARLAQTFGKGTDKNDTRVFMQFAKAVREHRDIVLKTRGLSYGNYCGIEDTVDGIITILHDGENGEAYNVVNEENTMQIRDMAELVAGRFSGSDKTDGGINVIYDIDDLVKAGYAPDTELRLSSDKLRKLGWKPHKKLVQMYEDILNEFS